MIENEKHYCDNCHCNENGKHLVEATHVGEPDPYALEINDDDTPVDLCQDCYLDSCENI